ncbi:hypothetical protein GOP47_0003867 [Adiantum capillus-veneris]|uniref:Uncharacterized protein n=1 Tax=Adiantum capillus-veneris TaxID=13818 RepID=A0A9D4V6H9_ADICA|nr:hypothetical protein GOP47_0003867 [Adiantum capillus-veneris]
MDQVMSAALSSHPIGVEKAPSSSCSLLTIAKPSRPLKYKSYERLCYSRFPITITSRSMVLLRNQHCLVHALPLQAVTTDNDSEGSTSPGPSSSVEYAGIFQPEQGAQRSLLYYVRVWYTNAKAQNVPVSIQQVLEKSKTELQTVDKSHILRQIKSSKLATFGIHWWESSQPWVKWPISIFIPWFFLVSLFYGLSASKDLLPLWVIGPLLTGLAVKASIQLSESYRQWLVDRKLADSISFVTEGIKTGQLPRQVVEALGSRFEEVKVQGGKKKEELGIFFQSGEYKRALRKYADTKLFELREAFIDKYEDWRLVYLYMERKMKNII